MKKAFLIAVLISIRLIGFGQAKTDSLKSDTTLVRIELTKPQAIAVLKALQAGYTGMQQSEQVSAAAFNNAAAVYQYLSELLFRRWPELTPKRP